MTTIAANTMIQGRVSGQGDLTVHGRVRGSIVLDGALSLEANGIIEATKVNVVRAIISGVFVGELFATERIDLTESARVVGNLYTPQLRITAGAQFRGRADTVNAIPGEQAVSKPAKVSKPKSEPARQPEAPKTDVVATVRAEAPRVARPEPARPAPRPQAPRPPEPPKPAPRPEPVIEAPKAVEVVARPTEPAPRVAEAKPEPVEPARPEPVRAPVRHEPNRFNARPEPRPAPRYEAPRPAAPRAPEPRAEARPEPPRPPAPKPEPPRPEPQKEAPKPEPVWANQRSESHEQNQSNNDSAPRPPAIPRGKRATLKRR